MSKFVPRDAILNVIKCQNCSVAIDIKTERKKDQKDYRDQFCIKCACEKARSRLVGWFHRTYKDKADLYLINRLK